MLMEKSKENMITDTKRLADVKKKSLNFVSLV